jgi:hypothetical protein
MRRIFLPVALALAACGDDSERETATSVATNNSNSGIATLPSGTSLSESDGSGGSDTAPLTTGMTSNGPVSDPDTGDTSGTLPKFDFGQEPDIGMMPPETGCTKVDLLFVVDSSGSMLDEQVTLVQSFPTFVTEMQTQLANTDSYHIGVISSDAYPFNDPACIQDGALVTQTGGAGSCNAVCAPFSTGKRWMDETEPDLNTKFTCAAQVGTMGDGNERPMHTMIAAVSQGLNSPGACNDGFIRPDALLVVVVITDEEDDHEVMACNQLPQPGSQGDPPGWFAGLVAAKAGVETNIVVLSLVGPVQNPCPALDKCGGGIDGAEMATRIVQFTEMFTYGSVGQICAPSYQQFFSDAISVIEGACENFMPPL